MSTNPFNDDYNVAPSTSTSFLPSSIPSHQQQQHQQPHHSQVNSNNNLPPPSQPPQPSHPPPSSLSLLPSLSFSNQHQEQSSLPPIWIARNVEWPLVSTLPSSIFTKLYRTSRNAGTSLGIATVTTNSVTVGNTTSSLLSIPSSKSMVAGTTVSSNYTDMESMNHNTSNHHRFGNNNNNWTPNSMNDQNNNGNLDNGSGYDNNDEFNNNSNADAKFSGSSSIVSGGGFGSNNTARGGANGMMDKSYNGNGMESDNQSENNGTGIGGTTATSDSGGYYTLGGLMGRVFTGGGGGNNAQNSNNNTATTRADEINDLTSPTLRLSRPLHSPRSRNVASSNGWIVACMECSTISQQRQQPQQYPPLPSTSPSISNSTHSAAAVFNTHSRKGMNNNNNSANDGNALRLLSRWNVRRGSSTGVADNLITLPPPAVLLINNHQQQYATICNDSRIAHVFVDPTGCHTLLSSFNGEAYYLHSSIKKVRKLMGFGPNPDGSSSCQYGSACSELDPSLDIIHQNGSSSTSPSLSDTNNKNSNNNSNKKATILQEPQLGLTNGTYVTCVAWDVKRSTEGSTKRILLGTNIGEIYEYGLVGPSSSGGAGGDSSSSSLGIMDGSSSIGGVGEDSVSYLFGGENLDDMPLLLVRLSNGESGGDSEINGGISGGGGVSGLHFQRFNVLSSSFAGSEGACGGVGGSQLLGGDDNMIVLAATSGIHKPTRFYTYFSSGSSTSSSSSNATTDRTASDTYIGKVPSLPVPTTTTTTTTTSTNRKSFRNVFSSIRNERNSFLELPGSIDYADLHICDNGFAMRTETGIYYGTIDGSEHNIGSTSVPLSIGVAFENGIIDSGILPYNDDPKEEVAVDGNFTHSTIPAIPVSIAITPYHFITLSKKNELKFINRVGKKVIQKEHIDWISSMINSAAAANDNGGGLSVGNEEDTTGELLVDIRRPDQIWLRKSRSLIHISSTCEDRDAWKFNLEKCLQLPRTDDLYEGNESSSRDTPPSQLLMHHRQPSNYVGRQLSSDVRADSQFEKAKALCSNLTQKAVVTAARAEFHLSHGRVELAAKYMAQCGPNLMPFAETAIKLGLPMIGIDNSRNYGYSTNAKEALTGSNMGLITYLSEKMRTAKARGDRVACTMIGAWLLELFLHEREQGLYDDSKSFDAHLSHVSPTMNNAKMQQFLISHVEQIDAKLMLQVLRSHDVHAGECFVYASSSGDLGTAVNAALCKDDALNGALDTLGLLNDAQIEQSEPIYYKNALPLLERAPLATANSFLSKYSLGLSTIKILPALISYERKRREHKEEKSRNQFKKNEDLLGKNLEHIKVAGEPIFVNDDDGVEISFDGNKNENQSELFVDDERASITYLEGVIKLGCQNTAVFNFLFSLYVDMEDEAPLFHFLTAHVPAEAASSKKCIGESILSHGAKRPSPLDMSYALRSVLRSGRHFRSAVTLYMGFGMRQEAVELSVKVDPKKARELARESVEVEEQKRLWLMIARNAGADGESCGGKNVVSKVLSVLDECGPNILSIEDVLPYMPDVAQIDEFKDEICFALTSYSSNIDHYLKEMNECDQTCTALREEISNLNNYGIQVKGNARCAFTRKKVVKENEPFYVFPSGFVALESALKAEVMPYLSETLLSRVRCLENDIAEILKKMKRSSPEHNSLDRFEESTQKLERLQAELDGLIAAECPLTGNTMIDSIDCGFSDNNEDEMYNLLDEYDV